MITLPLWVWSVLKFSSQFKCTATYFHQACYKLLVVCCLDRTTIPMTARPTNICEAQSGDTHSFINFYILPLFNDLLAFKPIKILLLAKSTFSSFVYIIVVWIQQLTTHPQIYVWLSKETLTLPLLSIFCLYSMIIELAFKPLTIILLTVLLHHSVVKQ